MCSEAGFVLLVCGGRDFIDRELAFRTLDRVNAKRPITKIVQGLARGADSLAAEWARVRKVPCVGFAANWNEYGKAAGAIRNQQMLDYGVDGVLAFPGGRGTADMVRRAKAAGVVVMEIAAKVARAET